MAVVNVFLDMRRPLRDGSYPIKFNIYHYGQIVLGSGLSTVKGGLVGNKILKKDPDFKAKNAVLSKKINQVQTSLIRLEDDDKLKDISLLELKAIISEVLSPSRKKESSFIYYLEEFASKKSKGTQSIYQTTKNKLVKFDSHCTFDRMDRKWLIAFEQSMIDSGMKVNAYAIHLRNIRAVFNWAIEEDYTKCYPFRKFKIKKEATRKRSLTVEQLRELRDYPCEEYQKKYRDIFILMFLLIGINAADLFLAKPNQVVNGRLEYKRAKTGRLYSVLIQPEAQEIIDRYKGTNYLIDVMDTYSNHKDFLHRMGLALKVIGEVRRVGRGGKKERTPLFPDISSYWTRHTWATIAAELDIPKEVIAHALGHSWAEGTTTDIYIRFDEKKVDDANRRIIDYVYNIEQENV